MITCQRYLSDAVAVEVEEMGYRITSKFLTGVTIQGTLNDCIVLNLRLRSASAVMFLLNSFEARDPDQLYVRIKMMPWENLISTREELTVMSNVFHPMIKNNMYANLRVKDAISDRMREKLDKRPNSSSEMTGTVVYLYWKGDTAQIYYNTSGPSIARHGYRNVPGSAPMLEALAAAAILTTKWNSGSCFINPMCGSGTLAIEAALISLRIPPSTFREKYAFMTLPGFDADFYKKTKKQIKSEQQTKTLAPIIATDISDRAIRNTIINATSAGVLEYINIEKSDFRDTYIPKTKKGIVFLNPEYGERLGDTQALVAMYEEIGNFFKKSCSGYWGYVFTGNMELAKKIGLRASSRHTFYNSKIECRLLEYELYDGSRRKPQG